MFAGKKSAQIREILISESAWEEMTCLFAPSLTRHQIVMNRNMARSRGYPEREKCFDDALKIIDELRKAEKE